MADDSELTSNRSANSHIDHPVDSVRLAFFVGLVALSLPVVVRVAAEIFDDICTLDTVSHYYYAPVVGDFLVGALFFIGAFMLVYKNDKSKGWEEAATRLAGLAAFLIALSPTGGSGCDDDAFVAQSYEIFGGKAAAYPKSFELTSWTTEVHGIAAAIVFVFLGYLSLFVFTRVDPDTQCLQGRETAKTPVKAIRNAIYVVSGLVIWAGAIAMISKGIGERYVNFDSSTWRGNNVTYWIEAAMLCAFGISWMVKGRFNRTMLMDETEKAVRRHN